MTSPVLSVPFSLHINERASKPSRLSRPFNNQQSCPYMRLLLSYPRFFPFRALLLLLSNGTHPIANVVVMLATLMAYPPMSASLCLFSSAPPTPLGSHQTRDGAGMAAALRSAPEERRRRRTFPSSA